MLQDINKIIMNIASKQKYVNGMNGQNLSYFLLNSSGLEDCLLSFTEEKAGLNITADETKLPIHCPIWQK